MPLYPTFQGQDSPSISGTVPTITADKVLTWPELVSATASVPVATWKLRDPKNGDQDLLLTTGSRTASFTPTFHSGAWVLTGYDASGIRILTYVTQLGDNDGWMTFPDWDDAAYTLFTANNIITARSGKTLTIASLSHVLPEQMDILYMAVDIPIGLSMETELYRSAISGNDDTSIVMLGAANNAASPAGVDAGCGIEQTTAGTQRAIRWKDNATAYIGAANASVRRARSAWALDSNNRSPAVIEQALRDNGEYFNAVITNYGGLGFQVTRDFGIWVGRVTADGNPYTLEATARIKVS